jgi:SAM-dependent methyltransferase
MAGGDGPRTWSDADRYEDYVGRWSRRVAVEFLAWLEIAPGGRWLDVGCGTGALSATILAQAEPAQVVGVDPSPAFLAAAVERVTDPRASFRPADAQVLPADLPAFDAVVSGLVLNFVPEPARAVAEMRRVVRPGGTVAAYVWDYVGEMELMRVFWDTAVELFPQAHAIDEGIRFAACDLPRLESLFGVELDEVVGRAITIPTVFASFDDYWHPFLGGTGPAPAFTVSLPPDEQARLRETLRARLPATADGAISLKARAWAVKGTRAG